jgi:hypothetical protein
MKKYIASLAGWILILAVCMWLTISVGERIMTTTISVREIIILASAALAGLALVYFGRVSYEDA